MLDDLNESSGVYAIIEFTSFHLFCHSGFRKNQKGGWGLYSSGRIVHLHQPPGAKGDILELKFGYDYDGEIDKQAQAGEISGRITDY